MGISIYGNREIAKNYDKKNKIFFELFFIKLIIGLFVFVIYNIFLVIGIRDEQGRIIMIILSGFLIASIFDISWFYMGIEKFDLIAKRQFFIKSLLLIGILSFVKDSKDIYKYCIVVMVLELFGQLFMWINIKNYINFISFKEMKLLSHIRPLLSIFIPLMITSFYVNMDRILIGKFIDSEEVAIYDVSLKIITILITLVNSITPVMISRISNTLKDKSLTKGYIYNSLKYLLLLGFPMSFGLISISKELIVLFLGVEYVKSSLVLSILSVMIVANIIGGILVNFVMIPFSKEKEYRLTTYVMAIMYLILDIFLIPKYGAIGAAIANSISHILIIFLQLYLLRKDIEIIRVINYIKRPIIISSTMLCMISIIKISGGSMILDLILKVSIGILVFIFLVFFLYKKEIRSLLKIE